MLVHARCFLLLLLWGPQSCGDIWYLPDCDVVVVCVAAARSVLCPRSKRPCSCCYFSRARCGRTREEKKGMINGRCLLQRRRRREEKRAWPSLLNENSFIWEARASTQSHREKKCVRTLSLSLSLQLGGQRMWRWGLDIHRVSN